MAGQHLTVLDSPAFPQAFDHLIDRVSRIIGEAQLGQCWYADEHCDCRDLATVHHLASEQEFCERHFQAVTRG